MSWNSHYSELCNKLSTVGGMLGKLKNILPRDILLSIYNSLFQSRATYGITAWGFHDCKRLSVLQKRAVRHVSKSKYNSHSEPILRKLNLLKIQDLFNTSCLKVYYKFKNNLLPIYLSKMPFKPYNRSRTVQARNINVPSNLSNSIVTLPVLNPVLPVVTPIRQNVSNCIRFYIPKLINEKYLPQICTDKISTHSMKGFITYSKGNLLNNYMVQCTKPNCYVCQNQ